jgi:ribonuclease E
MAKEICISSTPHETRLAILEDDQLAEIYYERENEYTLAGSIYNGRVTRVLPGMQSAFVDIGLERDAFLYVTDFMELDDQEETDELEKAAVQGGNQPPREVHHANQSDRAGNRPDRSPRERRPAAEAAVEAAEEPSVEIPAAAEPVEGGEEPPGTSGGRRWRGRRHRRGRGGQPAGRAEGEESTETSAPETTNAAEVASDIHAAGVPGESAPQEPPPTRSGRAPASFLLPGESLSKYGATPAEEAPRPASEPAAPARPVSSFKPATLIESPIQWDGSGPLPGESLSRHRRRSEPQAGPEPEDASVAGSGAIEEEKLVAETLELAPEPLAEDSQPSFAGEDHLASEEIETAEFFEESPAPASLSDLSVGETALEEPLDVPASSEIAQSPQPESPAPEENASAEHESGDPESGASASHRIDPASPTGFRLFGLGKKKKEDKENAASDKPASVAGVSAYAPGTGLIEEEVIDEEEFDAPHHHHHKADEHDLDDYEEETLPNQIRSGDLGELLQEAHLDHRIQMDFDEKNGEEESLDEGEEEEEPVSAAQTADQAPAPQRRDRGTRGRRGRGASGSQANRRGPSRRSLQTSDLPIISDLLKAGQEILVQIAKEPIAKKGARITSHIALPGRFLVFMPTVTHVGVSRKIASDEERQRLKRILLHERGEASGGFIVRTAAEGASEEELRADLRFLLNLWAEIKQRSDDSKSPALIYHDLSLIERILRDQVSSNFSNIWVDSEADYERIVRFLNRFSPSLVRRVKLYTKETPLFEHFGIQDEISKALRSKVWLKSGGSIVINQTEALVAIDINTGKYVGKSARLEDTIVKTNLDAVPEIVRQIRLRDLGGIIVIDFIDMDERKNRFKVLAALEEALKADRAPTKVLQFNDFGLVAITRKRVKQSLERTLSVPCPTCQATGMVKSPTTVCNEIFIEMRKMKKHFEAPDVLLRVNPETVKVLKANNARWLVDFEELTGRNILVKSDPTLHPEQFDIQG